MTPAYSPAALFASISAQLTERFASGLRETVRWYQPISALSGTPDRADPQPNGTVIRRNGIGIGMIPLDEFGLRRHEVGPDEFRDPRVPGRFRVRHAESNHRNSAFCTLTLSVRTSGLSPRAAVESARKNTCASGLSPISVVARQVTPPARHRLPTRRGPWSQLADLLGAHLDVELARDPRFVGATVGVLAVLHTWTQQLLYHPHVHCLVSGGGVSQDGCHWLPARKSFLVPVKALARLVRSKLRAAFQQSRPDLIIPEAVWSTARAIG